MGKRKKDRWPELCQLVADDDGLPVRPVGPWTENKLWFWNGYIDIATRAMSRKWRAGLAYVDLFAGPGVCTLRDSGKRIPGSTLIAANAPKQFRRIIACELKPEFADACEARLARSPSAGNFDVVCGDCNDRINEIVSLLPRDTLALAFVDPPGLDAHFETIRALSTHGRVDLLVLFADAVDALRNVDLYTQQQDSNLDLVLGTDANWRERRAELNECKADVFRRLLADIYKDQLRKLGYGQFGEECIEAPNGPLYRLVYASKHERGLDFWDKICTRDRGGQRRFKLE